MSESNFAELRRVRSEMSAEAGHNVRRFIDLLDGVRAKYHDRLVDHGAGAECSDTVDSLSEKISHGESTAVAQ